MSIVLKGVFGSLQIVGGIFLFFVTPAQIRSWTVWIGSVLFADPTPQVSPLRDWFLHLADHLNVHATVFAAVYLLIHGAIKVSLVWALWREAPWAYPWMLVALAGFIAYQCYEMVVDFSWLMLALTVFDLFVVVLTIREWQLHRRRSRARPEA
ncbi:MAG: DUF2127 domain-containing protein [Microbacterium sp.]